MLKVRIEGTGIPHDVCALVDSLPPPEEISANEVIVLEFPPTVFVYMTGLALLAAWRKNLPAGVTVQVDDSQCSVATQRLIVNTGFREIITTGHEYPSMSLRIGKVPLQPITNRYSKEATVSAITEIFDEYAGQVRDTNPFYVLLSELCENVLAHSEQNHPGYACARVMEDNLKAEIAIVDTGVGIRESYMRGTNNTARDRIVRGASSLDIAVEGLNSSKPRPLQGQYQSYYGYGLFITRRLIEENNGYLTIISGQEGLTVRRQGKTHHTLRHTWQGTFVGLVLDLANRLPLEEIYDEGTGKRVDLHPAVKVVEATPAAIVSAKSEVAASSTVVKSQDSPVANERLLELQHFGTQLLTREAGVAIRADLATRLIGAGKVVVVLDGVTDITPSVADEAFAKLAEAIGWEDFQSRVQFRGGSPVMSRLIEFVMKTRAKSGLPAL